MDETSEDCVYIEYNARTPGKYKGFQPRKAAKKRGSKVTGERVALVVVSLLLVAAVTALIVIIQYYNTQTKGRTEEMERTTVISHVFPVTASKNTAQCDEDWELNGEKCYLFSPITSKLSWNDSKKKCQELKGNLVKIDSREEQEFLDVKVQSLMKHGMDRFWIGLTDSETEGEWLWTDGSRLNTNLTFWTRNVHNTEPDNWKNEDQDGENCAIMGETEYINGLMSWYDVSCKKNNRCICEKPASRPNTYN